MSDRDRHPTERLQLAEIHGGIGTWPIAVAALDALGPEYLLVFRRGVLAEIRTITMLMEAETYEPALLDRLDRLAKALRHLPSESTLAIPATIAPDLTTPTSSR